MYDDLDEFNPDFDKKIEAELKASQKYLRGKSAKQIEAQLLSHSRKVTGETIELDVKNFQRNQVYNTYNYRAHEKLMDKRMQNQLEDCFVKPLDELSLELKNFDKRTTTYFFDKRWDSNNL